MGRGRVVMVCATFDRPRDNVNGAVNDLLRFFNSRQLRVIELNI